MEVAQITKKVGWLSQHKINRSIDIRVDAFFARSDSKIAATFNGIVRTECKSLVTSFVNLIRFHEQYRNVPGYRKAGAFITGHYDKFFMQYQLLFERNKYAPYFEEILDTWEGVLLFQKARALKANNVGLYSLLYQLRADMIRYYKLFRPTDKHGARLLFLDRKEAQAKEILQEIKNRGGLEAIIARYCQRHPELIETYIYQCKGYTKYFRDLWGPELIRKIKAY
jgi:hypothetical protein